VGVAIKDEKGHRRSGNQRAKGEQQRNPELCCIKSYL
jgi:hypothetical protein